MDVKGLAWDDKPEDYMNGLKRRLEPHGIELTVLDDYGRFLDEFDRSLPDFVVVDLFQDRPPNKYTNVGKTLADHVSRAVSDKPWYPSFIITGHLDRLGPEFFDSLPPGFLLRYKADQVFVARLIREDLIRRGVFTCRRNVFLIRHANHPDAEGVKNWLAGEPWNLKVVEVTPGTLATELTKGLPKRMGECSGIVAVCNRDQEVTPGVWRTRPNVTLEIGLALGLPRGLERLVIIKQREVERVSDLGGVLTLDYVNSPSEVFSDVEQRLEAAGVDLSGEDTDAASSGS